MALWCRSALCVFERCDALPSLLLRRDRLHAGSCCVTGEFWKVRRGVAEAAPHGGYAAAENAVGKDGIT
jgi:hypothetical protein